MHHEASGFHPIFTEAQNLAFMCLFVLACFLCDFEKSMGVTFLNNHFYGQDPNGK